MVTLLEKLFHAGDLLEVNVVLKEFYQLLLDNQPIRAKACRALADQILSSYFGHLSNLLFENKRYISVSEPRSPLCYLASSGMQSGRIRQTMKGLRETIDYIDNFILPPSGACLTMDSTETVMAVLTNKFPYFDVIPTNPLFILHLANSHKAFNSMSGFGDGEEAGRGIIVMLHMKDMDIFPEYVFLHELGHILQVAITKSPNTVPPAFLRFHNEIGGVPFSEGSPDAPDVFADTFAIAVMHGTELEKYNPFPFQEPLCRSFEAFYEALFRNCLQTT
ncbi:MAG: hypothetical protein LBL26_13010 [Peptococcaceae bacterium]|jgi:hypothetical protein|nr:hypothetical protein [Peptococcaceae bacterium]